MRCQKTNQKRQPRYRINPTKRAIFRARAKLAALKQRARFSEKQPSLWVRYKGNKIDYSANRYMEKRRMKMNKQLGMGVIKFIFLTPVVLIGLVILTMVFSMIYKGYWDYRVEQLCAKDGGRTIYEEIKLTEDELRKMSGKHSRFVGLPTRDRAQQGDKFVYESDSTQLHSGIFGLKVTRHEFRTIRLKDEKVIAEKISYGRRHGGFIPLPAVHHTSFLCPRFNDNFLNRIFIRAD